MRRFLWSLQEALQNRWSKTFFRGFICRTCSTVFNYRITDKKHSLAPKIDTLSRNFQQENCKTGLTVLFCYWFNPAWFNLPAQVAINRPVSSSTALKGPRCWVARKSEAAEVIQSKLIISESSKDALFLFWK